MFCLGIESTAHTFSCALLKYHNNDIKIISDIKKSYIPPKGEGIHPREASRHVALYSTQVLLQCLKNAKINIKDIDLISYSAGPGLGPCLRIGYIMAR